MQTLQQVVKQDGNIAHAHFNPNFRYLRVVVDGRVVFLALGNEDIDSRGPIEVWYSAEREVLRLQNGRLVGAVGLPTEWRHVSLPERLPSWAALAHAGQAVRWTRTRDVMPGYRFGISDALVLRKISPPNKSELRDVDPQSLTWFEEQTDTEHSTVSMALPPARYAVDLREGKGTAVYGEQCLAPDLCFTWQRWPAAIHNPADK
ncbi:MAG: YjbF family lipoprotein [Sulfuricella sp.]